MSTPTFKNAIVSGDGTKVILNYSEPLSPSTAEVNAFTVTVGGSDVSISSAEVVGSTIELNLDSQVDHATPVKVSYTDPNDSDDLNVIQDLAGNDAASFNNRSVRNLRGFTTYEENTQRSGITKEILGFAALKADGSVVTWGDS